MASIVRCENCELVYTFDEGERGIAWIHVEVHDGELDEEGDDSFLIGAHFCSPECAFRFLTDPEKMGTIKFPKHTAVVDNSIWPWDVKNDDL